MLCCYVTSVMSNSTRPQRRQPTRLPHPRDSPGKNTGVGCHLLLQCMKVKSESEVAPSCPTPSNPMDCSPPGSSIHGIFQARVLEWFAIAFSAEMLYQHAKWSGDSRTKCRMHKLASVSLHFHFYHRTPLVQWLLDSMTPLIQWLPWSILLLGKIFKVLSNPTGTFLCSYITLLFSITNSSVMQTVLTLQLYSLDSNSLFSPHIQLL